MVFELDCTSLAAVLIQRIIRGHLSRMMLKKNIEDHINVGRLAGASKKSGGRVQPFTAEKFANAHGDAVVASVQDSTTDSAQSSDQSLDQNSVQGSIQGSVQSTDQRSDQASESRTSAETRPTKSTRDEEKKKHKLDSTRPAKSTQGEGKRNHADSSYPESPSASASSFNSISSTSHSSLASPTYLTTLQSTHEDMIELFKRKAIAAKRAGDIQLALQYMQKYKMLQESIINSPQEQQQNTPTSPVPTMRTTAGTPVSLGSLGKAASPQLIQTMNGGNIELVEDYKQQAISAKKSGDTKSAIKFMSKYKALKTSLSHSEKDSRQESSPAITPPFFNDGADDNASLAVQIELAKRAAIDAKRGGNIAEAVSHMKRYKTMVMQQAASPSNAVHSQPTQVTA